MSTKINAVQQHGSLTFTGYWVVALDGLVHGSMARVRPGEVVANIGNAVGPQNLTVNLGFGIMAFTSLNAYRKPKFQSNNNNAIIKNVLHDLWI